jgi:hypothetical protein
MPESKLQRLLFVGGLCGLGALIALIVPAWRNYARSASSQPVSTKVQAPVQAPSRATTAPTGTTTASQPAYPVQRPQIAQLALVAARGDCWVEAHAGSSLGKTLFIGTLAQGKSVTLAGWKLWIRLGASGNVIGRLNGKPVTGLPAGTVTFVATALGMKNVRVG